MMKDEVVDKVVEALKSSESGMTITDIVASTKKSRSSIRTSLAKLEGARKVDFRNVGMAKLYFLRSRR